MVWLQQVFAGVGAVDCDIDIIVNCLSGVICAVKEEYNIHTKMEPLV